MNQKFQIVKRYIDERDVYCLLADGCPNDEFDIESEQIANLISETDTEQQIAAVCADVFTKMFGEKFRPKEFLKVAKSIKDELQNLQS